MRVFFICSSRIPNRGVSDIIFTNCDTAHCISSITITHCNSITKIGIILFTNSDRCTTFCIRFIANSSPEISTYSCFTTHGNTAPTVGISLWTNSDCISLVCFRFTTHSNAIARRICFSLMTDTDVISTFCPAFTAHSNRELTATSILVSWIRVCTVTNRNGVFTRCHRYITNRYRSTTCRFIVGTKCGRCTTSCLITITNSYCRVFCCSISRTDCNSPPIVISCILITYNNRIRAYMVTTIVCTVWRNINRAIP